MIENTFIILKGIGATTERKLWQKEILTWEDFVSTEKIKRISDERKRNYDDQLTDAKKNLENGNSAYFCQCLDVKEHWRMYEELKGEACFLDIETTGFYHGITVVGLYSKEGYRCFVRGIDLEKEVLEKELEKYKMLVTFFGRAFDMPFIEREFGISVDVPHVDLCFAGKKVGLKGGLKKVEQKVGIERGKEIYGLDGYDAVRLWRAYEQGDRIALDTLIEYNMADTVNLKILADIIYERLKEKTFLSCQVAL